MTEPKTVRMLLSRIDDLSAEVELANLKLDTLEGKMHSIIRDRDRLRAELRREREQRVNCNEATD